MYFLIKRFFDLFFAVNLLIVFSPIFILISIVLLFTGEGEVFYLQVRIGFKNSKFRIIKFATMLKNSLNMGSGSITLKNDPRVTTLGKYLRISKINELPQIINIIKGDLSFVGPRPLVQETFNLYSDEIKVKIYNTKPGLTGIGSVYFRNEEKIISKAKTPKLFYKNKIAPVKGKLELWYLKNQTFWTDFKILITTIFVVIFKDSKRFLILFPTIKL
tara:strand:- start:6607 stop:7257 length:651 start_codon:yes stop_codon:yes gene_type:complete